MRTLRRPRTTRQTPRNFSSSARNAGSSGWITCARVSENGTPACARLLQTEIFPQNASRRRDAFCGKISVCNNLAQAGVPFSLTRAHVIHPLDPAFRAELEKFLGVCRVVR